VLNQKYTVSWRWALWGGRPKLSHNQLLLSSDKLNSHKTEILWRTSRLTTKATTSDRCQHQLPTAALPIPVSFVWDFGIYMYIDTDLVMQTRVKKTASWWLAVLRQLRQIRRYVSTDTFQALVVALVVSRLDYCNAVLNGLPALSRRLQSVLNAAACLIFVLGRSDHCVGRTN